MILANSKSFHLGAQSTFKLRVHVYLTPTGHGITTEEKNGLTFALTYLPHKRELWVRMMVSAWHTWRGFNNDLPPPTEHPSNSHSHSVARPAAASSRHGRHHHNINHLCFLFLQSPATTATTSCLSLSLSLDEYSRYVYVILMGRGAVQRAAHKTGTGRATRASAARAGQKSQQAADGGGTDAPLCIYIYIYICIYIFMSVSATPWRRCSCSRATHEILRISAQRCGIPSYIYWYIHIHRYVL